MTEAARYELILLDNGWRPIERVPGGAAWPTAVRAMLRANGRWLIVSQRRGADGDVAPEEPDFALTRALYRRLRPLDIGLADHVIHAGARHFSFRAAGLL